MSSENFEGLEEDFVELKNELSRKIDNILPNTQGENRKNMLHGLQRETDEAYRILFEMENEVKSAPNPYRLQMNARLKQYRQEITQLKKKLEYQQTGPVMRNDLLGRPSMQKTQAGDADNRSRLLQISNTVERTGQSVLRAQQVAEETDQVGVAVIDELGTQRESLIRTRERLIDTDVNLTRSRKILRTMYRKVITNKIILIGIILLELLILGGVVYVKFFH